MQCPARENGQPVLSAGASITSAGKQALNQCQARENRKPVLSVGTSITSAEKQVFSAVPRAGKRATSANHGKADNHF